MSSEELPEPHIPATTSLPEITFKALVTGIVLSAVLAGANAYLGLKVGLTVSASIPAAVLSMAILRMFRRHNILENNIVQTAASAGESLAAGVIFTLPALIMLGYWQKFEYVPTVAIAFFGGTLGVMFTIPLRRALIIEAKLKFPEGVATGEVLKAGEDGGGGARLIAMAGIAGAAVKLLQTGFQVAAGALHTAIPLGEKSAIGLASEMSGALLAVGYIVRLNIAVLVFAGSVLSWFFAIPIYMAVVDESTLQAVIGNAEGFAAVKTVATEKIRFLGVGAMATGGLWAIVSLYQPIRDGIKSSFAAMKTAKGGGVEDIPRTERDTPIKFVLIGTIALAVPILIVFFYVIDRGALGIDTGRYIATIVVGVLFSLVAGFLFSSVAGYMAGLVGSSNNPVSGVTIASILTISLILLAILGSHVDFADADKAAAAAATALMVGSIVCCASAIAGDNMQDLKAGQIVGATPYKQQIMQIVGVASAALVLAPVLQLLLDAYGLGGVGGNAGAEPLEAPQAALMATVAFGVFNMDLPWGLMGIGSAIAICVILLDQYQKARESSFRTPVLAVAVGIYLPIASTAPIFLGGLLAFVAGRALKRKKTSEGDTVIANRRGLLFASGIITGEALIGITLAIPFAIYEDANVWAADMSGALAILAKLLGAASFAFFAAWMYRVSTRTE
ncbi:MAG: oligopeptide transporter, OPT family [Myxococcales bacterium]|nr:oligopeptide transporter, OPT family [Myxococcales bacterium]